MKTPPPSRQEIRLPRLTSLLVLSTSLVLAPGCQSSGGGSFMDLLSNSSGSGPMDLQTIIAGLKEALRVGTQNAVATTSKAGGFNQNPALRLVTPPEMDKVAAAMRKVGLGGMVDDFENRMNLAAEQAAAEAKPVFIDAVRAMTFDDARRILQGQATEATDYFRGQTSNALRQRFSPIISKHLQESGVARVYGDLVQRYNAIPFTQPPNLDLNTYVTDRTLDGLFATLAQEEKKIREDPAARTTALLQRVFGNTGG